jgi:hypothetical protein
VSSKGTEIRIALTNEQVVGASERARQAGFDSVEDWLLALVEVELRRAELEAQVAQAIDQGDYQQLAADLRDKLRVAPKPKGGRSPT